MKRPRANDSSPTVAAYLQKVATEAAKARVKQKHDAGHDSITSGSSSGMNAYFQRVAACNTSSRNKSTTTGGSTRNTAKFRAGLQAGPAVLADNFRWATRFIEAAATTLGPDVVRDRLSSLSWCIETCFSGVGCFDTAALSFSAAVGQYLGTSESAVTLGSATDWEPACQKVLHATYPDRCVFGDVLGWRRRDGSLREAAHCMTHGRPCPLNSTVGVGRCKVHAAGPSCVMFSKSGLRQREQSPIFKTHEIWMQQRLLCKEPLIFFENVTDYDHSLLFNKFPEYDIRCARVCNRHFGHKLARPRFWAIMVKRGSARWITEEPLEKLLEMLMQEPVMDVSSYFFPSGSGNDLTECMKKHLDRYRRLQPDKNIYDLSQNPESRCRTELKDGSLPTLQTNTVLWSDQCGCALNGVGMLTAMGVPVIEDFASLAKAPQVIIGGVSDRALRKMAGNGMTVQSAGAMITVAALFVEFNCSQKNV